MTSRSCPLTSESSNITNYCVDSNELEERFQRELFFLLTSEAIKNRISPDLVLAAAGSSITRSPLLRNSINKGELIECVSYIVNELSLKAELDIGVLLMFVRGFASNCAGTVSVALDPKARSYSGPARVSSVARSHIVVELLDGNDAGLQTATVVKADMLPGFPLAAIYEGPVASHMLDVKSRFQMLRSGSRADAQQKIASALAQIEGVWPELLGKISEHIVLFVLAETSEPRNRVVRHGSSAPDLPGVIFMNDYHCPEISLDDLAENIVHESVHNMLFSIEDLDAWYDQERADELDMEIGSVWSSRTLTFYSFFHSLIVFSTINSYIERVLASLSGRSEQASWLMERNSTLRMGFARLFEQHHHSFLSGAFPLSRIGQDMYRSLVCPHYRPVSR